MSRATTSLILVLSLPAVLVVAISARASALEPNGHRRNDALTRAFFSEGKLWMLSDAGKLFTITEGKDAPVEEALPEPVLDLCLQDQHPVAITCQREGCRNWTLRRWAASKWSTENSIQTEGDNLLGMSCAGEQVTLLTSRRLIESVNDKQTSVVLSDALAPKRYVSMLDAPNRIFIGVNEGEWGGGLWRIDRNTGKVAEIARNTSGQLCGGPLNSNCDPVNALAFEPWKPGCIAAAIGLVHFNPSGRIVEICGDDVRQLYYKPYRKQESGAVIKEGYELSGTVAFFGLTRERDALWATGSDGIYRIDANGATMSPLPKFRKIGDINVSFDLPHVVLVLTSINARHSVSGPVAMIVPR
jgi:hypothetical protein